MQAGRGASPRFPTLLENQAKQERDGILKVFIETEFILSTVGTLEHCLPFLPELELASPYTPER